MDKLPAQQITDQTCFVFVQVPTDSWDARFGGFGQRSTACLRYSPALQPCSSAAAAADPAAAAQQPDPALQGAEAAGSRKQEAMPVSWLLTGGAGALGLLTAAWLARSNGYAAEGCSAQPAANSAAASAEDADQISGNGAVASVLQSASHQLGSWKRLVLTSRSGQLAAGQQPELARQLQAGSGQFASCCVTITR